MKSERKVNNKAIIGFCLLFLSSQLLAATYQVPKNRTITEIRTYEDHAVITLSPKIGDEGGDPSYNLSCDAVATLELNNFAIDWSTDPDKKTLYNAALAAKALGLTVGVGIKDTGGCYPFAGGVPVIFRIDKP